MTDLKRTIRCSNCGVESNFSLGADFELNEITVHARCSSCGNSIQINYNIVGQSGTSTQSTEQKTEEKTINLEEDLFGTDMLNKGNDIRDIIEES